MLAQLSNQAPQNTAAVPPAQTDSEEEPEVVPETDPETTNPVDNETAERGQVAPSPQHMLKQIANLSGGKIEEIQEDNQLTSLFIVYTNKPRRNP